jgi:hypothetical protein
MGQLAPNPQRAVRVVCSSPKGDDRKLCETSSFKNSSRSVSKRRTVALTAVGNRARSDRTLASTRASLTLTSDPALQFGQSDTIVAYASSKTIVLIMTQHKANALTRSAAHRHFRINPALSHQPGTFASTV